MEEKHVKPESALFHSSEFLLKEIHQECLHLNETL